MDGWLGSLYNRIAEQSFAGYFSRYLNHDETKEYYTRNVIINFSLFVEFLEKQHSALWKDRAVDIIEHFEVQSSRVVEYLALKYPQQQRSYVSSEVREAIQSMDNSDDPTLDYLHSTGCPFKKKIENDDDKPIVENIKLFFNKIISLSEQHMDEWRSIMKELFAIDGKPLWNQVGRKIKENTPTFTQQEIKEDGIRIKAPEMLRVVLKWIEELERKLKALQNGELLERSFMTTKGKQVFLDKYAK